MKHPNTLNLTPADVALLSRVRTPVAILEDGILRYVNEAFTSLFETYGGVIQNRAVKDCFDDRFVRQLGLWQESDEFDRREPLKLDVRVCVDGHRPRWLNGELVPAMWDGRLAIAAFFADIDERKRNREVEEKLRQSQKMEALGRLAGGVAHDMNNLLAGVMGFASVIDSEVDPDSRIKGDVAQILSACRKGRDLMLNLMGFARRGKYRQETFHLGDSVRNVIELLKHTIPKKIRIAGNWNEEDIKIYGDSSQIHHAFMNLCLNAVDAMGDEGTLTIEMDTTYIDIHDIIRPGLEDLEEGEYARIVVRDTGTGMSGEILDKALEPFFTTKPQGKGAGLGLPMVYGTIANHGGAVVLESQSGLGTAVTVLLPLCTRKMSALNTLNERRTPSELSLATILLVDDEEIVRTATSRLLKKLGYRVLCAGNGREAMRLFVEQKDEIALVLLDLVMPVMDGEETLAKMTEVDPDIPVLLCSGYSKEEKAEELLHKGASGFIQKPYEMATLKERIRELMI